MEAEELELVELAMLVELVVDVLVVLLVTVDVVLLEVVVVVGVEVVTIWFGLSGSRWKIAASDFAFPSTCVPTANPSCGPFTKTESRRIAGAVASVGGRL